MIRELIGEVEARIGTRDDLTPEEMWSRHEPAIWQAKRLLGAPDFYPVYRCGDLYSYSPLSLILHKGGLRLNPRVARRVSRPDFLFYIGSETIDRDIVRLGGALSRRPVIRTGAELARQIAGALRADAHAIESRHPGYTNVILCGGKDSLNLLLLPWRNPVIALSAAPNYQLARDFVERNGLGTDVVPLEDRHDSLLSAEIVVNCCRNNLEHCRWGGELRAISQSLNEKVIFWKGQMGNIFMTPQWKAYTRPTAGAVGTGLRMRRIIGLQRERQLHEWLQKTPLQQWLSFRNLYRQGAMWQGAHMSFLRQLTGALVLSGYHGPAMGRVLAQTDLQRAVRDDIRPLIGHHLLGREVSYPATNPGPPPSTIRAGISHLAPFLHAVDSAGIPVLA